MKTTYRASEEASASQSKVIRPYRTLADGLEARQDNFLLLRFIAASLVIYGHAYAITGGTGWPEIFIKLDWGVYSGDIAVDIFFIVSGFMITGSYLRRQHLGTFLWARVLRIFPALFVCLLLSAFVMGALYTSLSIRSYVGNPDTVNYVIQNLKMQTTMVWNLPGVFLANPKITTVNGAIWTLPIEFRMYLWVAALGFLGILSRAWLGSFMLLALFIFGLVQPDRLLGVPGVQPFLHLAAFFTIGAFFYLQRRWIPVGWSYVAVSVLVAYLSRNTVIYPYALGLALSTFVFAFAYAIPWYAFNRAGDYSYGIYLWGFPTQQMIAYHFPNFTPIQNAVLSFFITLLFAVVSWHFIEKPALQWKEIPSRLYKKTTRLWQLYGNKS